MKYRRAIGITIVVACILILGPVVPVLAGPSEIDAQMKLLTGDDAEARQKAREVLSTLGAEAVPPLLTAVGHSNRSVGKAAEMALFDLVARAGRFGGEHERSSVSKALAAELSNASLPQPTRAYLCRLLGSIGREEAVPALVVAMGTKDIGEMARWALSGNPTAAALDALHEALPKGEPAMRIGLINAIGTRQERRSVKVLTAELKHSDEAVRIAAMEAISRIPDPFAMDVLRPLLETGSPKERQTARACWFRLAETLLEADRPYAASVMYGEALKWATSVPDRCAVLVGIGRAGQLDAIGILLKVIQTADDRQVRGAVVQTLEEMKGAEVSAAITNLLAGTYGKPKGLFGAVLVRPKPLSPSVQVALLRVLIARKEKVDPAGVVAVLKSNDESARIAALECLALIGDEAVAPDLAPSLRKPEGPERSAAVHALVRLKAPKGLAWLQQMVDKDDLDAGYRCVLIGALGERRDPGSVATLCSLLKRNPPEPVRVAAFDALGRIGHLDALPALLSGVDKSSGKDRDAAEAALNKLSNDAVEPMIEVVGKATPFQKVALLKVLGHRKNPKIKPLLLEHYASGEPPIKAAAVEGLRRMADPSTLNVLEEAATKGIAQTPAVAGMIRIANALEKDHRTEALRVYHQSLKLAKQDRERQAALTRLMNLADPSSFDAIRPFLTEGNVKVQAAEAMLAVGVKLPDDRKADVIEALRASIALAPSSSRVQAAVEKLVKWGVQIDLAGEAGFITHWWVVGPFPSPEKKLFDQKLFPEEKVDLGARIKVGDKDYGWKKVHVSAPNGVLDLHQAIAQADNVGGYAYAEVTSDKPQDVLFKIGSDDDVICWLNGNKIHANKVDRGLEVDADVVKARLESGVNRILLKVLNGGGSWAVCLRITDPQNKPLKLEQRKE